MSASLIDILKYIRPSEGYACMDDDYSTLCCPGALPNHQIPTLEEIEAARAEVEAALAAASSATVKWWPGKREFDAEFSDAETYQLEVSTDPTLIVLRGRLNRWEGEIRADDSRVQSGLAKMVEVGILTTYRKAAIDGGISG